MEIEVYKINGEKTGRKVQLEDSIFAVEPNDHAIYLDVKQYLANKRQGTSCSKERSDVKGSRRKIKRQKGTGTARAGDIKNPMFRGGGTIFGPKPRDYSFKLNKKLKKIARKSALTYKMKENNVFVVEDFDFESPKTSNYIKMLKSFNISDKKTLLVLANTNKNVYLSSRNLKKSKVVSSSNLSTYEILNANNILFAESSIEKVHSNYNIKETEG